MAAPIRIGVIGDFEPAYHSHFATNAALHDAAAKLKTPLELQWLPTPSLEGRGAEKLLRKYDGLIASPGSPYKSFTGMFRIACGWRSCGPRCDSGEIVRPDLWDLVL